MTVTDSGTAIQFAFKGYDAADTQRMSGVVSFDLSGGGGGGGGVTPLDPARQDVRLDDEPEHQPDELRAVHWDGAVPERQHPVADDGGDWQEPHGDPVPDR
jgi:hypothetical protein